MQYNLQVDNQIHKMKVDSLFPIKFANTILSQLPRTCFAVLVMLLLYSLLSEAVKDVLSSLHRQHPVCHQTSLTCPDGM